MRIFYGFILGVYCQVAAAGALMQAPPLSAGTRDNVLDVLWDYASSTGIVVVSLLGGFSIIAFTFVGWGSFQEARRSGDFSSFLKVILSGIGLLMLTFYLLAKSFETFSGGFGA